MNAFKKPPIKWWEDYDCELCLSDAFFWKRSAYEDYLRDHASEGHCTHQLGVWSHDPRGATFLVCGRATCFQRMPGFGRLAFFWTGSRGGVGRYEIIPAKLGLRPLIPTLLIQVRAFLRRNGFSVVERSFTPHLKPRGKRVAWIQKDSRHNRIVIQLKPKVDPLIDGGLTVEQFEITPDEDFSIAAYADHCLEAHCPRL